MKIVYLDQNKWIALARAAKRPGENPGIDKLLLLLSQKVQSGELVIPLTSTNIYETYKIGDPERRRGLAFIQAGLSRGRVFRGRYLRLEFEISDLVRRIYGLPAVTRSTDWFLSEVFFEATAEWSDPRLRSMVSEKVIDYIRRQPADCLFDYLTETQDHVRKAAVTAFSDGSEKLRQQIEERRQRHAGESISMRRRILSALLMINEIELILAIAQRSGAPWNNVSEIGSANARRIINEVPTYYVEREIALRIETQSRPIQENDFRDMQTFCTVLAYADHVIAENQFIDLARQAGLGTKYGTEISPDILSLYDFLR